jgi:hypothetical protein
MSEPEQEPEGNPERKEEDGSVTDEAKGFYLNDENEHDEASEGVDDPGSDDDDDRISGAANVCRIQPCSFVVETFPFVMPLLAQSGRLT